MFIADVHIHSKYSRATSKECVPEFLDQWARRKGLHLIGTGDFTHPAWRKELCEKLIPAEEGLYTLKREFRQTEDAANGRAATRFIVSGEISSIYKKSGKVRKVHNLILLPSLEAAAALAIRLEAIGCNLHSDGRPILGLDSHDLLQMTLDACPEAIFIPAHIWTPHFSLFGAYSGFDDIRECYGDLTGYIHALETGLSSDPPMNWRLSALDGYTLVSNSDAHSPGNLAREANLFDTDLSYPHIARALEDKNAGGFCGTLEFFPEEGKYHYDGHRACQVCLKPSETRAAGGKCPVCGGKITVGVLSRVEALADRAEGFVPPCAKRFESLVPLAEIVASSLGVTAASAKARASYENLVRDLGPELYILREASLGDIGQAAGALVAEGIRRLRSGKVDIRPGYDGEYGKVSVMSREEINLISGQMSFLGGEAGKKQPADVGRKPRVQAVEENPLRLAEGERKPPEAVEDVLSGVREEVPYGLNREQWAAVSALEPAVAVVAGPGTGKTKTLVSRIAWLVETQNVKPSAITAVTFTNKAAGEMRLRLEKQFGSKRAARAMTIGTFHGICLQILSKQRGGDIPIIDEADALALAGETLDSLGLKNAPRDILRKISLVKNGMAEGGEALPPGVYDLYNSRLAALGMLDYDDLLLHALALFEKGGPEAPDGGLFASFYHLLVDEFQDINVLQYRLIRQWGKKSAGIFIIGDPDQSIYGFRGSDPRCFARFLEEYNPVRRVMLTQNYRSTPQILRCAQAVIRGNRTQERATALAATRESGAKVRLLTADDAFAEALFVTREIGRMVGGMNMLDAHDAKQKSPGTGARGFSDIAVLYRTNRQAGILEQCLQKEGIPYTVAGRDSFLLEPEVRHTVAFFRHLENPRDLAALRIVLRGAGCPAGFARKVLEGYAAAEKSLQALEQAVGEAGPAVRETLALLLGQVRKYAPLIRKEKPEKLLQRWMGEPDARETEDMEKLLHTSVMYDTMPALLNALVLGSESDLVRSGGKKYVPDAISLMTLHGAKGLEFPVVFLCGATEDLIPFKDHSGNCSLEEELRILYVGMTRARDELVLMTSPTPSPFLGSLPGEDTLSGKAFDRKEAPGARQLRFFDL